MDGLVFFTIISKNYAAQARVLAKSLATFHPDRRCFIVAADGEIEGPIPESVTIVNAGDIAGRSDQMALYYDAVEYNTALKPLAFRHIFEVFRADEIGRAHV